ncbi:MAG: PAS domain-containing protein [Bryobacterales bacterium]
MRRSRLRAALDGSGTGAWIWELSTRNFFCDTVACRNLGVGPGKVLSLDDFLNRISPEDRSRVEAAMTRASMSDQPLDLTARITTADDAVRYVALEGGPELDARGAPIRFNGAPATSPKSVAAPKTFAAIRKSSRRCTTRSSRPLHPAASSVGIPPPSACMAMPPAK